MQSSLQGRYPINASRAQPATSGVFNKEPKSPRNTVQQVYRQSSGRESSIRALSPIPNIPQNNRTSTYSNVIPGNTIAEKQRTLQKYKYINQLARLDYEDKVEEVYTKYTKLSKATVMKKIKARNQIAQFEDEDQDENVGFDQLMEFKYGKDKNDGFFFENEEKKQYDFCEDCDNIHNDHPEAHITICQKKRKEQPQLYSPYAERYKQESLARIKAVVDKIKNTEYEQLARLLSQLFKITNQSRSILPQKRQIIINDLQELAIDNRNDPIFNKIMTKVNRLVNK